MRRIGVIGAGAWGTALAAAASRAGREVVLWAYEPEVIRSINESHENTAYLPGVPLDPAIRAVGGISKATDADAILLAAPAQRLREVCTGFEATAPVMICAKGIEQQSGALMSEVVAEALPGAPIAILTGPTFASEVARRLPAALTLACADQDLGEALSEALRTPEFRIYQSSDMIGAQIGGAVKNVLAIACGIVEGRGLGDNARAALITRGLAEIVRLGMAKGAKAETFLGLCGLGDITLTCNAMQSRNFSLGVALGKGESLGAVLGARNSVAEGVFTASSVIALAHRVGVEMPIAHAVNSILNAGADIGETIAALLARPLRAESFISE
ncbi:MAG: NAD(P)-dependent glycerol-3-phosphate dehydrogenase [Rhodospirillales bacterium]|jgi:glycerol-3-phosphate dehydrogenase (NAD(P)+)|nr:NAD(P)-dependent glycerol-3-phosphate dehydrogenase [Rhodospirillales bacterium]